MPNLSVAENTFIGREPVRRHFVSWPTMLREAREVADKLDLQVEPLTPVYALSVAELMRLLVDEHQMSWDVAWDITRKTLAYTDHTLLPEALEKWPIHLFGSLLPRHLEIIYEINCRFLDEIRLKYPNDASRIARMSLIDEKGERYVRMAHLATVGTIK